MLGTTGRKDCAGIFGPLSGEQTKEGENKKKKEEEGKKVRRRW